MDKLCKNCRRYNESPTSEWGICGYFVEKGCKLIYANAYDFCDEFELIEVKSPVVKKD